MKTGGRGRGGEQTDKQENANAEKENPKIHKNMPSKEGVHPHFKTQCKEASQNGLVSALLGIVRARRRF